MNPTLILVLSAVILGLPTAGFLVNALTLGRDRISADADGHSSMCLVLSHQTMAFRS